MTSTSFKEGLHDLFRKSETLKNLSVFNTELKLSCSIINFIRGSPNGYFKGKEICILYGKFPFGVIPIIVPSDVSAPISNWKCLCKGCRNLSSG